MRYISVAIFVLITSPVSAHPGEHAGQSTLELVGHLAQPDHLLFLVLTIIAGCLAYRAGRSAQKNSHRKELP